jgi:hypothetical protein
MLRILTKQPGHGRAQFARRRIVLQLYTDLRRMLAGRLEPHGTGADHVGMSD